MDLFVNALDQESGLPQNYRKYRKMLAISVIILMAAIILWIVIVIAGI